MGKGTLKSTRRLVFDLLTIGLCFLMFTTFGWASFHIPSSSMEPTLEVGDRLFVAKYAYGYNRYSVPFEPAFVPEDRLFADAPKRGDVVVFKPPHKSHIIKRVIGLPGDTVQVTRGRLFINGTIVPRTYVRDVNYTDYQGMDRRAREYVEDLPGGVTHRIYERTDHGSLDNTGLYKVPEGHYFMMGDNRDGSGDSRILSDIGYVSEHYLVGRAQVTTFSLYDCDQGKDVSCPMGIPTGRFFNVIE